MESLERTNQQYLWQFRVDCVQLKKTRVPAIALFFFQLLIGWEIKACILIQSQGYFSLPAQSAGKRVLPWLPFFLSSSPDWLRN